ncbi:hypothetical protein WJX81_007514 [Elliptochloris bilobata]|uniref:Uncharacterized protein n=1 Tax=Elliptochloris bilobata TaxID=381761 RepID=A0AAW1RUD3_9CHLO
MKSAASRRSNRKPADAHDSSATVDKDPSALGCNLSTAPAARPVAGLPRSAAIGGDVLRDTPRRRRGKAAKRAATSLFADLPDYLRDNEYITRYYRADYSVRESLASLFRLHNETGNIWSHLAGALLFLVLTGVTLWARPAPLALGVDALHALEERLSAAGRGGLLSGGAALGAGRRMAGSAFSGLAGAGRGSLGYLQGVERGLLQLGRATLEEVSALEARVMDAGWEGLRGLEGRAAAAAASLLGAQWPAPRWPIHVFTGGAITCMLTSSACHLLGCCSFHISQLVWRFDYAGIVVLIVTSFAPPVYYGFLCEPFLRNFYLLSTLLLGVVTVTVSLAPVFQQPRFRAFRASLFAALGLWGIAPAFHGFVLHSGVAAVRRAFAHDLAMGAIYLVGAATYALRMPERWWPGAFDLAFHSHQLFHLCVVAAAAVHYRGVRIMLAWRDSTGGCLKVADEPVTLVKLAAAAATLPSWRDGRLRSQHAAA